KFLFDTLALRLRDHRAEINVRPHWIAKSERARERDEAINELLGHALEHIEALARSADLTHVEIRGPDRAAHRHLQINIIADDERIVAAEFEIDLLDALGRKRRDSSPRRHAARERDDRRQWMRNERFARFHAIAGHNVDHARRS